MSNLRIKNKKLKRELESLKAITVPPNIIRERHDIVTLRSRHRYDDSIYGYIPEEVIVKSAIWDLMDEIKPYINIDTYRDRETDKIVADAELKIIK